jgi:hypothetical protein
MNEIWAANTYEAFVKLYETVSGVIYNLSRLQVPF